MNSSPTAAGQGPGQDGAGHGEQVPDDAPPQPALQSDANAGPSTRPRAVDTAGTEGTAPAADEGAPVVFTPDDVGLRPPDHPPTESAPESEKAGLIFERS